MSGRTLETGSRSAAERFLTAWKALETHLVRRWEDAHRGQRVPDAASVIAWGERTHLLSPDVGDFLHSCRSARNAYVHVSFGGYSGPVAQPPVEVVHRLERVLAALVRPAGARSAGARAVTCAPACTVGDALGAMQASDYSQLPYLDPADGWLLVTREQVCRWLEAHADDGGMVLADLQQPVADLARHPAVGPVVPRLLPAGASVSDALEELEGALRTPDAEPGGYPAVLVVGDDAAQPPWILASDDLPRLYDLLGR